LYIYIDISALFEKREVQEEAKKEVLHNG